jgi:DNA-binding response OmpR family regulator
MRMILEVALGTIGGWEVSLAADGEEALAAARAQRPDLILLDAAWPASTAPGPCSS